ncbi:hypothetical protein CMV_015102 [Castanea mollissima]|uniref:F-box domain-containing protein n=1 Tax=Castanea mollissima TaxID=60419 RepID=A0A8J4VKD0_9ROSI|nr:hypothetical protein CMV_015102 [Castanea mollissima]
MMDLVYLPYDVLVEILHGLPVKSLIRFRYVDVTPHVERYKLIHEDDNDNNVSSSSEQIQDLKLPLRSSRSYFQLVVSKEESEQEEEVQSVGCHICPRWCSVIVFSAKSALRQKITTIRRSEGCRRVMWQ